MQTANAIVDIGGDQGNQVPKYNVTASELAVLRAIHGEGAVHDVEPTGEVQRSNGSELERLRNIYGRATDSEHNSLVNKLFPGAAAPVFQNIEDLNLPQEFFKPTARAQLFAGKGDHDHNGEVGGAAPAVEGGLSALTVAKLKEMATAKGIDLGDATKKDDIIAAIEAATDTSDGGVDDMPDAPAGEALFK